MQLSGSAFLLGVLFSMPSLAAYCGLYFITFLISVTSKRSSYRRLWFPGLAAICLRIMSLPPSTGNAMLEYQIGLMVAVFLAHASTLTLLNDPQVAFRKLHQSTPAYHMSLKDRLGWATDLTINLRGVNWSFEPPRLRRSTKARWAFVRSQALWTILFYLMNDMASSLNRINPVFEVEGESMEVHGLVWQAYSVLAFWFTLATAMQLNHTMLSMIAVLCGVSEPRDWPCFFGWWLETRSVRAFWGYVHLWLWVSVIPLIIQYVRQTWHQVLRRVSALHSLGHVPGTFLIITIHCSPLQLTENLSLSQSLVFIQVASSPRTRNFTPASYSLVSFMRPQTGGSFKTARMSGRISGSLPFKLWPSHLRMSPLLLSNTFGCLRGNGAHLVPYGSCCG